MFFFVKQIQIIVFILKVKTCEFQHNVLYVGALQCHVSLFIANYPDYYYYYNDDDYFYFKAFSLTHLTFSNLVYKITCANDHNTL